MKNLAQIFVCLCLALVTNVLSINIAYCQTEPSNTNTGAQPIGIESTTILQGDNAESFDEDTVYNTSAPEELNTSNN